MYGKKKDKKGIRLRNTWHHNILLRLDCTALGNQDTLRCVSVHTTPYAVLGLTLDVKAQSLRGQQQVPSALADL